MKKRVFITGATGFVGSHLLEYLSKNSNYELYGTAFGKSLDVSKWIKHDRLIRLNLMDKEAVYTAVQLAKPHFVIHLAALTSPRLSFEDPQATLTNNISAQVHLLNALTALDKQPEKVVVIGSAEEYGRVTPDDNPITEEVALNPTNPYAVSKIAQDYLGLQYFLSHELPVVRLRPFNHTGERRPPTFVLPAFARQVAMIEAGKQAPVIKVGNLEPVRDFTDVKDMVRAYELALLKAKAGDVYNIGTGKGVVIKELLDNLLHMAQVKITVEPDRELYKPADVPMLVANPNKFIQATGWQPQISFEKTIKRVLDYWRHTVTRN
jgi:GDP-4-dehydro-6-deoxy-D-mannose reductase